MNAVLSKLLGQWDALGFNQKLTVGTLAIASILAAIFFFNQAQEDYDVLYSNLSLPDASAAVAKLRELKVPYKLADDGTTILVPRPRKNDLVLQTASELSSDQTVNLSQIPPIVQGDVQKEWIRKYNTDAIAQILKGIRGIKNAQVIVSQPEKSLFADDNVEASASVMLMAEPGFHLSQEQAKTIRNLVAHAVPGLKPEQVVLADNTGNPLDDPRDGQPGSGDSDTRRHRLEEDTTRKIINVLGPVVGRENLVVSVSAVMNFDQSQSKVHRVIPMGGSETDPTGVTVSQQDQIEEYANKSGANGSGSGGANGGGIPGTQSNIPTYQTADGKPGGKADAKGGAADTGSQDAKGNNYRLTKRTTNYANSEEDRQIVHAVGTVERLSISVVLNKVLTSQEIAELKEVVANAAGADEARGDSVDVKGFQFSQPVAAEQKQLADTAKAVNDQAFILQLITTLGGVILGGAGLFIAYKLFYRPAVATGELIEPEDTTPLLSLNGGDSMGMQFLQGVQQESDAMPAALQPIFENLDPDLEMKRNTISQFIEQEPSEAARFLLSFIKDEDANG